MRKYSSGLHLVVLLVMTWLVYQPGTYGVLHFDDIPNLGNLESAVSPLLLVDFVFSGMAGPTGRPLSLLSFTLQHTLWPHGLHTLLQTNVALHLFAGVAVYALARGLARVVNLPASHAPWIALSTTALWALSPFLASAQLMLVQRMTTLSGLFVFAGLAAYVWGRLLAVERPRLAWWLVWSGLIPLSVLATLSKENGALLLPLALAIEYTLLRRGPNVPAPQKGTQWVLWSASLAILIFLLSLSPILWTQGWRPYTPWQRLISQPPILLDYLSNLLLPRSSAVAPYTQWVSAVSSVTDLRFIVSLALLAIVTAVGWLSRRWVPTFWFALVFFFVGHASESSLAYLELYFAHRNYVPAFGIYFLVAVAAVQYLPSRPWMVGLGLGGYVATFCGVLWLSTSLWGQPLLAAEIWAKNFPQSIRAQHALANQYTEAGDYPTATRLLDDLEQQAGKPGLYRIQPLLFCIHDAVEMGQRVEDAFQRFATGPYIRGVGETVELLTNRALTGECPALTPALAERLADAVLHGHTYAQDNNIRAKALYAKALIAGEAGNINSMLNFLDLAFKATLQLDLGFFRVSVLVTNSRFAEAMRYLDFLEREAPDSPLKRRIWAHRISEWRALVADTQSKTTSTP